MTKRYNDPRLDRARFAADDQKRRVDEIAKRVGELRPALEKGSATSAQTSELAELIDEMSRLRQGLEDIFQKVEEGDPAPHLRKV
ncbi:hypothetical protein FJ527_26380 [Mesorhizobium sp. B2-4-18]|uniref:hypothetical protein n=1 Tax=Mesorhizobium sp. B2-4-18 TaxID=2589931 RepID=UPI001128A22E|nr:hypothetical protein [Mesorhizobium sp. B2-4-18]TPK71572.1 hypothetical protein FJ527_26380 [Mesorhizobium sp. B2-4-18]